METLVSRRLCSTPAAGTPFRAPPAYYAARALDLKDLQRARDNQQKQYRPLTEKIVF